MKEAKDSESSEYTKFSNTKLNFSMHGVMKQGNTAG